MEFRADLHNTEPKFLEKHYASSQKTHIHRRSHDDTYVLADLNHTLLSEETQAYRIFGWLVNLTYVSTFEW